MPGRVVCWQSPPLLLRDRDRACLGALCHLGLLMLCRPGAELRLFSLLGLACPCSFPACCVTHWCQGSRGDCLRPSLPQQGGRGKEAEPPAQRAHGSSQPITASTQRSDQGSPADVTALQGSNPGWTPCSSTSSCVWHLTCIPEMDRTGRGFPTQLRTVECICCASGKVLSVPRPWDSSAL